MELRSTRRREPVRPHLYVVEDGGLVGIPAERGPGLETNEAEWIQRDPDHPWHFLRGLLNGVFFTVTILALIVALAIGLNELFATNSEIVPPATPSLHEPIDPADYPTLQLPVRSEERPVNP